MVSRIPIKLNCFVWMMFLNKIPIARDPMVHCITLLSIVYPFCNADEEDVKHVFFRCPFAKQV